MLLDPRAEPQYGERVPYILFQGEAKLLQVDRAISPEQFLADPYVLSPPLRQSSLTRHDRRYRIDAMHYITRSIIPPLSRIFNLVGADVASWYAQMDKSQRITPRLPAQDVSTRAIYLEEHFTTERCVVCDQPGGKGGKLTVRPSPRMVLILSYRSMRRMQGSTRRGCTRHHVPHPHRRSPSPRPPRNVRQLLRDDPLRAHRVRFDGLSAFVQQEEGRGTGYGGVAGGGRSRETEVKGIHLYRRLQLQLFIACHHFFRRRTRQP